MRANKQAAIPHLDLVHERSRNPFIAQSEGSPEFVVASHGVMYLNRNYANSAILTVEITFINVTQ